MYWPMRPVAPLAGARIETAAVSGSYSVRAVSRPSRARELKLYEVSIVPLGAEVAPLAGARIETAPSPRPPATTASRPSRARELKPSRTAPRCCAMVSRPSRARELKPTPQPRLATVQPVAPLAGARIETHEELIDQGLVGRVAPLAGARIETRPRATTASLFRVAPLAGARIETRTGRTSRASTSSRPSRARELKHRRGRRQGHHSRVAPLAGARIETTGRISAASPRCRAPRGREN